MARRAIRGTPTPIATPMAVLSPELKAVLVVVVGVGVGVGDVDAVVDVLDGGMFVVEEEEDVVDDETLLVLMADD